MDKNKLINTQECITYYYSNGEKMLEENCNREVVFIENVPNDVKNAFIAIEDKRFFSHNGIDVRALFRATFNNIKSFSLKEGASTISQQLIKNTHLSSEKTLKRKVAEIKLARQLEKNFAKEEILEMYLNTIYFGDGCYGIANASKHYFNKDVSELNLNEGAILAGVIKSPATYSPHNKENCYNRKNIVLSEMLKQDYITHNQYKEHKQNTCDLIIAKNEENSYLNQVKNETIKILNNKPYYSKNIKVYTTIDAKFQKILNQYPYDDNKNSIIILDSSNNVLAYYSNCNEQKRQAGSTLKPILCYAPAIELDLVSPLTKIDDIKTSFNDYTPSNYGDKYYGSISIEQALKQSSNVVAVKLLNMIGVENSLEFIKKTDFPIDESDNSLALALGSTKKGATIKEIASLYNIFQNNGYYNKPTFIKNIDDGNFTIYKNSNKKTKILSSSTTSIMNDILNKTATNGTAKKLSSLNFDLYSKTGTVGNKNGNTDAYSISYNKDYTIGVWQGNVDGHYLENNITGGGKPTSTAYNLWNEIYKNKIAPKKIPMSDDVIELEIDKISYEQENKILLADNIAPKNLTIKGLFKKSNVPNQKSSRFSSPEIENAKISVNQSGIYIQLCVKEYYGIIVYKDDFNKKIKLFDYQKSPTEVFDENYIENTEYQYSIVPYFSNGNEIIYGKEYFLDKIKTPSNKLDGDWWLDNE
ncbi:MAG: transglycosylase domain-containing protein [Clostridia bacterium]|nr:transglycosylase domain-containing protein [Clostridia bacterium]